MCKEVSLGQSGASGGFLGFSYAYVTYFLSAISKVSSELELGGPSATSWGG